MQQFIPQILHDYHRWKKASDLLVFTQNVIHSLNANVFFPNPDPPLLIVQQARDDLEIKDAASKDGSKTKIAERRQAHRFLITLLDSLANYADYHSGKDMVKLESSGFHLQHARQRAGELPAPANFRVKHGHNSGEVLIRCRAVKNASGYVVQYNLLPDLAGKWITMAFPNTKIRIAGLQPGQLVHFRIAAVGYAGSQNFTDITSLYIV